MAKRFQRKRVKGYKLPDGVLCVTRPGKWGNPFDTASEFDFWMRRLIIESDYSVPDGNRTTFDQLCRMIWIADNVSILRGVDLACWCSLDKECHADSLLIWANQ